MINRRDFIRLGSAFGLVAAVPGEWPFAAVRPASGFPGMEAFADTRYAEGRAFAAAARAQSMVVHPVGVDPSAAVTRLAPYARERPTRIVGLTTLAATVVVEAAAADLRMRVRYRGLHGYSADGLMRHELEGDHDLVRVVGGDLAAARDPWAVVLAMRLERLLAGDEPVASRVVEAPAPPSNRMPLQLVSWVIG